MEKHVLVIQRRMTHYRVAFFESLRNKLSERGIGLSVAYGSPNTEEKSKNDAGELRWASHLPTRYFLGGKICWQPFGKEAAAADLVVITPENKLICNLWEQYCVRERKLAFWGHGANLQGDPASISERFKRVVAKRADWWFGYTDMSVPLITASGFPAERITVLNNALDTQEMATQCAQVSANSLEEMRQSLGLRGQRIGVYVGSLYEEKRIPFMLEAAQAIRTIVPDFEFLIVGGGPERDCVESFCAANPWAHYLGVRKGQEKVDLISLAQVMINPGAVGLGILDSFVCRVPMLTTNCSGHGPEIAYLKNGVNGLMTPSSLEDYVPAVCALLNDERRLAALRKGCEDSGKRYTIENMARNFADGVERCLLAPAYR